MRIKRAEIGADGVVRVDYCAPKRAMTVDDEMAHVELLVPPVIRALKTQAAASVNKRVNRTDLIGHIIVVRGEIQSFSFIVHRFVFVVRTSTGNPAALQNARGFMRCFSSRPGVFRPNFCGVRSVARYTRTQGG